ncbi:MAG: hypothetical protein RIM99_07290 [Cyclobacteriaceae bacterium]
MKNHLFFTLLFLTLSNLSFGQVTRWSLEDSISRDYLKELVFATDTPEYVRYFPMNMEEYLDHFHPVHINLDNDIDLIFNGPSGGESFSVKVYLNRNGKLELVESDVGAIQNVTRKFPDAPLTMDFLQYGCCDDPINFLEQWTILHNNPRTVIRSSKYYFMDETEFPESWNTMVKFKVTNTPYTLRATPEIINDKPLTYHYEQGNKLAEYSDGDIGYAISSKTDETGRVWWFVSMNPPNEDGYSVYKIRRSEKWLGWMSSRFLEKIK